MSGVLLPLVPLYAAATGAKNLAYGKKWLRPNRLRQPVISIGNLSVGGSGKTPLTIRLAELLRDRAVTVDVLSRGYKRHSTRVARVLPDGSAAAFGDEPLLIARSTGVPVYVGKSRYAAGLLAEQENPGTQFHLLDDGFQHRRLARVIDIVVLHRSDLATGLMPAGRLREPLSSLSRAQILVLREEDADLEKLLRARGLPQPIWWMRRELDIPAGGALIAFCAIARPDEFFSGVQQKGITIAAARSWRDHHSFTDADIASLIELLRHHGATGFVTTEKDIVRLSPELRRKLAAVAPLQAARLVVRLRDEDAAINALLGLLPIPTL